MKNRFRSEIDARLADLTFTGQDQVLDRIRSRRPVWVMVPKRTVVLLLALMLTLCGTAVALTLRYSARFDLVRHARGVLSSTYGLTGDMMDLFASRVEQDENGWTVRFSPIDQKEQMGEYTVTGTADGSVTATWSNDDADESKIVWRAEQLQQFMDVRKEQQSAFYQSYNKPLTLEERAAIDAPLLELPGSSYRINVMPDEDDLQPEEAERLVRQAIMDKYGLRQEAMDGYRTDDMYFELLTEDGSKQYDISLYGEEDHFRVNISSPEGEITYLRWWVSREEFRLPEGNLADYPEAAKNYVDIGAFDVLSPEEKAEIYQRFEEAGLSALLPEGEYVAPTSADLNEQAAIARAKEAMEETYDFPEEAFKFFAVRTAMVRNEEDRVWRIQFIGQMQDIYWWLNEESLGNYTVNVSADGADATCEWSLQDRRKGGFTPEVFGISDVYDGECLGFILKLLPKLDAIVAKYQDSPYDFNMEDMSLEDQAAFDGLMRQAGFSPKTYSSMMPKAGDMPQQEALKLAYEVLKSEYGVTDEALDKSNLMILFYMRYDLGNDPIRGWDFWFRGEEMYSVFIDAEEGVVVTTDHDDLSMSNG